MNKIIFLALLLVGCASSNEIEELKEPNMQLYKLFGFEPNGDVIYQFYHEFGFTDKVWHLITISKPGNRLKLKNRLPLDSLNLGRLKEISISKFMNGKTIKYEYDYEMNADVSLLAQQFYLKGSDIVVNLRKGSYTIQRKSDIEMIRIYDAEKNLEYLELIK
jgi:hypothetical protein